VGTFPRSLIASDCNGLHPSSGTAAARPVCSTTAPCIARIRMATARTRVALPLHGCLREGRSAVNTAAASNRPRTRTAPPPLVFGCAVSTRRCSRCVRGYQGRVCIPSASIIWEPSASLVCMLSASLICLPNLVAQCLPDLHAERLPTACRCAWAGAGALARPQAATSTSPPSTTT
jgi:hypothetical protein